ncbi:hypothetical protein ACTAQJ_06860 [Arthrobacter sp. alpha11c]
MTTVKAQQRTIRVPLLSKASGQKNVILGLIMLAALLAVGAATVQGFLSGSNVRSMLLLGAFLGLASVGQTLCALLGRA